MLDPAERITVYEALNHPWLKVKAELHSQKEVQHCVTERVSTGGWFSLGSLGLFSEIVGLNNQPVENDPSNLISWLLIIRMKRDTF